MSDWKKTIFMAAMALSLLTTNAQNIYQEDFSKTSGDKEDPLKKIVEVTDNPELKYALRLETVKEKGEKPTYRSWSSSVFNAGQADVVEVDYYMKAESATVRYGMFVMDNNGRQLVAAVNSNGFFEFNSGGEWKKVAPLKYGAWHHLRYVLQPLAGTYSVYVDDMEKPKATGIKFRYADCGMPTRLWTEGSEMEPSVSYFGKISVTSKTSTEFPPVSLSGNPHFIAGINKTAIPPKLDGKGDSECWKNIPELQYTKEGSDAKESSSVKLLWDDNNFYVFFSAQAADMEKRKTGETKRDARVWLDDCFEIFINPDISKKNYFHMAANSVGGMYDSSIKGIKDSAWNSSWKAAVNKGKDRWTLEAAIPFKDLGGSPKTGDIWGFNACRENSVDNEVSAWRPLQSFHMPEMFGKILFIDSDYLKLPRKEQLKKLGERLYDNDRLLKDAAANIKAVASNGTGEYFKKACDSLDKEIIKTSKLLASVNNFVDFYRSSMKAKELFGDSEKLRTDSERMKRFFEPGSVADKRGYTVCVESSMSKIPAENYAGSAATNAELQLAGREYGSFQAVLLPKPGLTMNGVTLKFSDFKDKDGKVLSGAKINSFMVDYVTTAQPAAAQKKIADVLWPGKEFKFKKSMNSVPLWFDVYVPQNSAAGEYSAVITVTPDGSESVDIPVKLTTLPFSIPLKASLPTAFCFNDSWVEGYYGKKIPQNKHYEYFQFILDHHLEPMDLWNGGKLEMSEEEMLWAAERGKTMMFLKITRVKELEQYYKDVIKKFDGKLKPVFFGHDEILMSKSDVKINKMKDNYKLSKELFPNVPRLNTSAIDERLFGYVDIWCPLFSHFNKKDAESRVAKGEQVWWYPTDYPLEPYANFNLDSSGMDSRIIPWMNWKLETTGLLYWGLNREWLTNHQEAERLTDKEKTARGLDWMTSEIQEKIKKGMRWPDVPWIPYFRSVVDKNASPSSTNGGGNLMYPGPDFQPIPSIRLKNLRDGLQDYEYFVMLKNNLEQLKKNNGDKDLIARAEKALAIDNNVVGGAASYTKSPEVLTQAKNALGDLIVQTQNALKK